MLYRLGRETHDEQVLVDSYWNRLCAERLVRDDLVRHLSTAYGFEAPLEAALSFTGELGTKLDLRRRARAGLIAHDLLTLGVTPSALAAIAQCPIVPFGGHVEALGWLYVAERAVFHHDLLRRQALRALPDTHLVSCLPEIDAAMQWNTFACVVDSIDESEVPELVGAARDAFRCQEVWMQELAANRGVEAPWTTGYDDAAQRTLELCCRHREHYTCMKAKGHTGPHECLAVSGWARWD